MSQTWLAVLLPKKAGEFLLIFSNIQLRTTLYNQITYYIWGGFFSFFFLFSVANWVILSWHWGNFPTKKIYTFLQAMFHSPLMFTWKPVIWNHSVLQVLGIRWKWRMLSCPIDFNPLLFWLSYFKWRSLKISLLETLHKNFIKENKISFLFIFFIFFLWTW